MLKNDLEAILLKVTDISNDIISREAPTAAVEGKWPERSMRTLQDEGFGGLVAPEEQGGLGQGLYGLVKVCEAIAQKCASTSMCFGMHSVGTAVLSAKATDYQKKHFIQPIIDGKFITTIALSEPGSGSHFYYPQTELTSLSNEHYKINGKKSFITNGNHADIYVISTLAVDPNAPANEFSCIAVEKSAEGLNWGEPWKGMGMRGNSSLNLELKDVVVPSEHLLGEKGDQLWYVFNVVTPYFLMAMSGTYLGIAIAAFEEASNHLRSRSYSHSGTSLANVQILQHRLGTLWAKLERTRGLIYHAARQGDKGEAEAIHYLFAAKAEVANCAVDLVNEAMTLTGGISYRENSRLDILLRDARASHVMAPTTDLLYTWIGRALLEQPILGD